MIGESGIRHLGKLIYFGVLVFSLNTSYAQIGALTQTGEEVVLYPDGTWAYVNDSLKEASNIAESNVIYKKDPSATFLVKSSKVDFGIWINPKIWTFSKGGDQDEFEYFFQKKNDDLYGMLIAERVEIPVEALKGIAIDNARSVAPDVKVVNEEYRMVNGQRILMMQMVGTIQGMRFTYYGYYYSNVSGSIQLITYTGENLMNELKNDMDLFLSGFVGL